MPILRQVVEIDEELCDGCGLCIPACHEGALQLVDGKAKLVSDVYCDGLGSCLGECPQGAIRIIERVADEFSEEAVAERLQETGRTAEAHEEHMHHAPARKAHAGAEQAEPLPCGCPGSLSQSLQRGHEAQSYSSGNPHASGLPQLENWPVQIKLAPLNAPYFQEADILLAADCAPFAFANFHEQFIRGKVVLIGCPKLDDAEFYVHKLAHIFANNDIRSVEVAFMEVPCCGGLVQIAQQALAESKQPIELMLTKVGIRGDIQLKHTVPAVKP